MSLRYSYRCTLVILLLVGEAGLEPATPGLEGRCSIQLSYSPALFYSTVESGQRVLANASSVRARVAFASSEVRPQAVRYAVTPWSI